MITVKCNEALGFCGYCHEIMFSYDCFSSAEAIEEAEKQLEEEYYI